MHVYEVWMRTEAGGTVKGTVIAENRGRARSVARAGNLIKIGRCLSATQSTEIAVGILKAAAVLAAVAAVLAIVAVYAGAFVGAGH